MDLELKGKIVLIGGASIGIGRGCGDVFAEEGARVSLVARDRSKIETVADEIRATGGDATAYCADLTNPEDVNRVVDSVLSRHGRIDVLVNVVYLAEYKSGTLVGDDDHWHRHYEAVMMGQVRPIRAIIPHMVAGGGGSVINISSAAAGKNFLVPVATYSAFKASLSHWTKNVAKEFALDNIRVNAVMPGTVFGERRQPLIEDLARRNVTMREYFMEANKTGFMPPDPRLRNQPITYGNRVGVPRDIANVVAFLASNRAKRINGAWWNVDGGSDF